MTSVDAYVLGRLDDRVYQDRSLNALSYSSEGRLVLKELGELSQEALHDEFISKLKEKLGSLRAALTKKLRRPAKLPQGESVVHKHISPQIAASTLSDLDFLVDTLGKIGAALRPSVFETQTTIDTFFQGLVATANRGCDYIPSPHAQYVAHRLTITFGEPKKNGVVEDLKSDKNASSEYDWEPAKIADFAKTLHEREDRFNYLSLKIVEKLNSIQYDDYEDDRPIGRAVSEIVQFLQHWKHLENQFMTLMTHFALRGV